MRGTHLLVCSFLRHCNGVRKGFVEEECGTESVVSGAHLKLALSPLPRTSCGCARVQLQFVIAPRATCGAPPRCSLNASPSPAHKAFAWTSTKHSYSVNKMTRLRFLVLPHLALIVRDAIKSPASSAPCLHTCSAGDSQSQCRLFFKIIAEFVSRELYLH